MKKDFDVQLSEILGDYEKDLTEQLNELTETTSDALKRKLGQTAPVGYRKKLKKSFRVSKEKGSGIAYRNVKAIVYSTEYRLLHLVENGHVKKNGGRTRASHFVAKAVDEIIPKYEKGAEEVVKKY